jgi:hypothetical protein
LSLTPDRRNGFVHRFICGLGSYFFLHSSAFLHASAWD